jgi:flagellar protein FliS
MTTELSYRKSSIAGASPIGLMIALFDTLAGDFRRAALALRNNDIETRCKELNHAILVIGQLESWIDLDNGGESAKDLARFYAFLRAKMMEAAGTKSAEVLENQIEMILGVRGAWQQLDASTQQATSVPSDFTQRRSTNTYMPGPEASAEHIPLSLSA